MNYIYYITTCSCVVTVSVMKTLDAQPVNDSVMSDISLTMLCLLE